MDRHALFFRRWYFLGHDSDSPAIKKAYMFPTRLWTPTPSSPSFWPSISYREQKCIEELKFISESSELTIGHSTCTLCSMIAYGQNTFPSVEPQAKGLAEYHIPIVCTFVDGLGIKTEKGRWKERERERQWDNVSLSIPSPNSHLTNHSADAWSMKWLQTKGIFSRLSFSFFSIWLNLSFLVAFGVQAVFWFIFIRSVIPFLKHHTLRVQNPYWCH